MTAKISILEPGAGGAQLVPEAKLRGRVLADALNDFEMPPATRAIVQEALQDLATQYHARRAGAEEFPSVQKQLANLRKVEQACVDGASDAALRELLARDDVLHDTLAIWAHRNDKLNGREPRRWDPAELARDELRQAARNAIVNLDSGGAGGRPRKDRFDGLKREIAAAALEACTRCEPRLREYFIEDPHACIELIELVLLSVAPREPAAPPAAHWLVPLAPAMGDERKDERAATLALCREVLAGMPWWPKSKRLHAPEGFQGS